MLRAPMYQPPYQGQQPYPGQQQYPQMGAQQPPPKKGMSGCLLAFLIVFGLFIVGGGITGFVLYRMFVGPVKEMVQIVQDGQNAPGTDALRAEGCKTASAMDTEKLFRVVKELAGKFGAKEADIKEPEAPTTVLCQEDSGKALTCDQVAETYSTAASPKDKFVVLVQEPGGGQHKSSKCSAVYDATGKKIGDANPNLQITTN